jgi:hypothetical protein
MSNLGSSRTKTRFEEMVDLYTQDQQQKIPVKILDTILNEYAFCKVKNDNETLFKQIRTILKKMNLLIYYEYVPYIVNTINKSSFPVISEAEKTLLTDKFMLVSKSYDFHKYNFFLNQTFILYKLCQLTNIKITVCSYKKNSQKLLIYEKIWKELCDKLNWNYLE